MILFLWAEPALGRESEAEYLARITGSERPVKVWSFKTSGKIWDDGVALSKDGNFTIVGSFDGKLYFLDKNGSMLWNRSLKEKVYSVAITSDGNLIVAGTNSSIWLFSKNGEQLWRLPVYGSGIDVAITPTGNFIVAAAWGGEGHLLDRHGNTIQKFQSPGFLHDPSISDDGTLITFLSAEKVGKKLYVFANNGSLLWKYSKDAWELVGASISPDSRYVGLGVGDLSAIVFDSKGNQLTSRILAFDIECFEFSPDGSYIGYGKSGDNVLLYDRSGRLHLYPVELSVHSFSFSKNGLSFVVASHEGEVTMYDNPQLRLAASQPAFESLLALAGLLTLAYLTRRKRVTR
jgi:WD40 repeat protein